MATLREIQLGELDILKEIDRVCRENDIRYSILWGTMLGAIRHKGYIPWDDDADVCILAQDVKKFQKALHSNLFFFQSPETDIEMPFGFYKVRKNGTFMEEKVLKNLNIHKGLWVDVFLLFPAGKSTFSKKMQYQLGRILHSFRCRYINARNTPPKRVFLSKIPRKAALFIDRILFSLIQLLGSRKSCEYFIPCDEVISENFMPRKYFDQQSEYDFDGLKLFGPEEYHSYLVQCFGPDYMIPKKYGHQTNYNEVIV